MGIRSVFRHFSDIEALYREMDARLESEVRPLLTGGPRHGSRSDRVRRLIRQRATFFERIGPYKRSGNLLRWRSPFLRDRHQYLMQALRADLLQWLPELTDVASEQVEAVDLATSFESWDRLRTDRGLTQKSCIAVIERTVLALLGKKMK